MLELHKCRGRHGHDHHSDRERAGFGFGWRLRGFAERRWDEAQYDFSGRGEETMFGNGRGWRDRGHRGPDRGDFGFGPGHDRPERPFEQGDLRWLVLDLIAAQPRHGYEIIKEIETLLEGRYAPSPGVIYPTLTFLEETGLITSEENAKKKLYTITDEGKAALVTNAAAIQGVRDRIDAARSRFGGRLAPELMRAVGNLRGAIAVRLSKGELSPETVSSITAIIDRAAGEIERS